jgi:V/A-type H+/Na+-transporting ATPase subunit I
MIAKMKKLSLIMHQSKTKTFLTELQNLGLVHINETYTKNDELSQNINDIKKLKTLAKELSKKETKEQEKYTGDIFELITKLNAKKEKIENLKVEIEKINKKIKKLQSWGNFDFSLIEKLKEKNINIDFYMSSLKNFKKLNKNFNYEIINQEKNNVYFITINNTKKLKLIKVNLPSETLDCLKQRKKDIEDEIILLERRINDLSSFKNEVKEKIIVLENSLSFSIAMESSKTDSKKLSILEGWIPEKEGKSLKEFLDSKDLVYILEEEEPNIKTPVKLENKKTFKIFEPITKLFDLPIPTELDLTPFFAPFFAMFFGLCLGDSGYGVIIFLASLLLYFKVKKLKGFALLGLVLGLATVFWGLLTGTFFGINLFETKLTIFINDLSFMKDAAIFTSSHVFYLSLLIGVLQILFGMCIQFFNKVKQSGFLSGLSVIGWIILVFFVVVAYLKGQNPAPGFNLGALVIDFSKSVPKMYQNIGIITGILLILFFNDTKANIFLRLGKGIWELYGITGFVGDLLSYIRLFALGASSAILGTVINAIALKILQIDIPIIAPVIFLVFLIFAHFANLAIAALGAFVHPLRLTFVEFYKNAGFTGGGVSYSPFKKQNIEN